MLYLETTHPKSEHYSGVSGFNEAYEERKAAGVEFPGLIKANDWLGEEWASIGDVLLLTCEEVRGLIEEAGFVVEDLREDVWKWNKYNDIVVGCVARKPAE